MLCDDVLRSVAGKLQDEEEDVRRWPWTSSDGKYSLMDSLNAAIREIVMQRPDATAETRDLTISAGEMRQALPSDAVFLIDLVCNRTETTTEGVTTIADGAPIFQTEMGALKTATKFYAKTGTIIQNWAYSKLDNKNEFYVYPALTESKKVRAIVSKKPPTVSEVTDDFPLPDLYANAAISYMMYDLLSGDTSDGDASKASQFYQVFANSLGIKLQTDMAFPIKKKEG